MVFPKHPESQDMVKAEEKRWKRQALEKRYRIAKENLSRILYIYGIMRKRFISWYDDETDS